jgi:RNA polymerase sigma-70 factor (ECF subfamily)
MGISYRDCTLEELLLAYQKADARAFAEFYDRTSPALLNFLTLRLRARQDAEDCLHDTYLRIHRAILSYDASRGAMAWIFAIARNQAIDHLRKHARRKEAAVDTLEEIPAADHGDSQLNGVLVAMLDQLAPEERQLVMERYVGEASYDELARHLGATEESVRQRISRIIKKLRSFPA